MLEQIVNLKKPAPSYFHCFKLNDSSYVLFDNKLDMPLLIGSIAVIKSIKLPTNHFVFFYKTNPKLYFQKAVEKLIDITGENAKIKPPLRFKKIDDTMIIYHHFKINPAVSALFDVEMNIPIMYGSNQKIQMMLNKINKSSTILYYKEDVMLKKSYKYFMQYNGKKNKEDTQRRD
jgi:hypothetical protein